MAERNKDQQTDLVPKKKTRSKYDPAVHPPLAAKLKQDGKTNKEVADELEISTTTLQNWAKAHPEFNEAIKSGRKIMVAKVHKSLFENCFEHEVKERRILRKRNGATGEMVVVQDEIFVKVIPANILAIQILLYNCDPEHFKRNPSPAADKSKDPLIALLEGIKDIQKGGGSSAPDACKDNGDPVPETSEVMSGSDGTA